MYHGKKTNFLLNFHFTDIMIDMYRKFRISVHVHGFNRNNSKNDFYEEDMYVSFCQFQDEKLQNVHYLGLFLYL